MAEIDASASTSGLPVQTLNIEKIDKSSLTNHQPIKDDPNSIPKEVKKTDINNENQPGTSKASESSGSSRTECILKKKTSKEAGLNQPGTSKASESSGSSRTKGVSKKKTSKEASSSTSKEAETNEAKSTEGSSGSSRTEGISKNKTLKEAGSSKEKQKLIEPQAGTSKEAETNEAKLTEGKSKKKNHAASGKEITTEEKKRIAKEKNDISEAGPSREKPEDKKKKIRKEKLKENCEAGSSREGVTEVNQMIPKNGEEKKKITNNKLKEKEENKSSNKEEAGSCNEKKRVVKENCEAGPSRERSTEEKKRIAKEKNHNSEAGPSIEKLEEKKKKIRKEKLKDNCEAGSTEVKEMIPNNKLKEKEEKKSSSKEEAGSSNENTTEGKKIIVKENCEAGPSRERSTEEKKRIAKDKIKEKSDNSEAGSSKEEKARKRSKDLTIEEKIKEERIRIANEILKEKIRKGKEEIEKREKLKKELENKSKNGLKRDKSTEIAKLNNLNEAGPSKENHEENSKQNSHENGKDVKIAKTKKKKEKLLKNEKETNKALEQGESSKTKQEFVKVEEKKEKALKIYKKEMKKENAMKNNKTKNLENALTVEEGVVLSELSELSETSDTKSIKVTKDARNKERKKLLIKKKSKCKKVYGKPDWQKHISYLRGNQNNSDFQFIIGEEETIFYGHKFIFACRSPKFDKLFFSGNSFDGKIIIPGVKSEDFKELYNYVYTGKIVLTGNSVEGILRSSDLCKFSELTEKCDTFLTKECLKSECEFNVFEIFKLTNRFKLPLAEAKCLNIFASKYKDLFESPEFLICSKNTLMKIINYPMNTCKEIDLYFAVDKWADKWSEEKKIDKNTFIKDLVKNIRFKSMSLDDFLKVKDVFTSEEIEEISKEITTGTNHHQRLFQKNLEEVEMFSCNRFPNPPQRTVSIRSVRESELFFITNKFILCYGLGIFGFKTKSPDQSIKQAFIFRLMDQDDEVIAKGVNKITFDGSTKIYEMLFEKPIVLQPQVKYKFWIKLLEKKPSIKLAVHCGVDGVNNIETNGCIFRFQKTSNAKIKHDTSQLGILASVLFKV